MGERTKPAGEVKKPDECPPFEVAIEELVTIVNRLEEGTLGLAESIEAYERGVGLLKQCYGQLRTAERKIELLSGVDAQGNPITVDFDDEATLAAQEKSGARSRKRSAQAASTTASAPQNTPEESEGESPGQTDGNVDERPLLF